MFEKLKNYPLLGLTLAIAGGLVLAHLINKTGDYLYETDMLTTAAACAVAIALICVAIWKRGSIFNWLGRHKRVLVESTAVVSLLILFTLIFIGVSNGPKTAAEQQTISH